MTARAERRFEAMGTDCHIVVVSTPAGPEPEAELDWAVDEVRRLQGLWSRFEPDSELSRLNRHARGSREPYRVGPETQLLARRALEGYELSEGAFDPFLADEVAAAGYDRTFSALDPAIHEGPAEEASRSLGAAAPPGGTPDRRERGPAPMVLAGEAISLAPGRTLDSGGIGKGLAADVIAERLLARGAIGALVNLGGDLRCIGSRSASDRQERWEIRIDDPWGRPSETAVRVTSGAVCTSTEVRRRWTNPGGSVGHHLLEPRTGRPAQTAYAAISVIAPRAWIGEVLAKALLVGDAGEQSAARTLAAANAHALITDWDGSLRQLPAS